MIATAFVASLVLAVVVASPLFAVDTASTTPAYTAPFLVSSQTTACVSSPFVSNPSSHIWYRVPSMIQNSEGEILAFAERRDNDYSDMGNFDIVMRKSGDGGKTWGTLKVIGNDGTNRVSNPVPMIDPYTGDVLLLSSIRTSTDVYKGVYVQRSTDGGDTFTSLLSSQIRPAGDWKGGLPGPGHGLVLRNGPHAGRILVAFGYRKSNYYGAYCIYSDNGGRTWTTGFDQADTSGAIGYMEGTLAELPDGRIYVNYRDKFATTPGKTRLSGYSSDGGRTFSTPLRRATTLLMHSCAAGTLNPFGTNDQKLFFSAPTYLNFADRTLRRDVGIFPSTDGGATWGRPYPVELESKPGSYSDLVQLNNDTVGILYETGVVRWRERIAFRRIPTSEITNPTRVASTLKAGLTDTTVSTSSHAKVKATVGVSGISSPPGKVTVKFVKSTGATGSTFASLTYSNHGVRYITLPHLSRGTYTITVTYGGTYRILPKTVSGGKLKIY